MDIEVIERKENPLLHREEVTFKVSHPEAETPTRESIAAKLAAIVNADRDMTIVKKVESEFGKNSSLGYANVYEDEASREIEPNHILKRNGIGGEADE
ncbi:MAG: 30S ribosomal protein S24e [Candidatus Kariarchaeaceae archaeon]|jgi:small subunit ribosomal protein S24e